MASAIFRYEVPVDDQWHHLDLSGEVLSVGCRDQRVVEFWALHSDRPAKSRLFRVFGTGQPLPDTPVRHHGTVVAADGALVWHLMEEDIRG